MGESLEQKITSLKLKRKSETDKENDNGNDKQRKGPNSFSHFDDLDKNDAKENNDK